jgi:fused signal recognition particle receptor
METFLIIAIVVVALVSLLFFRKRAPDEDVGRGPGDRERPAAGRAASGAAASSRAASSRAASGGAARAGAANDFDRDRLDEKDVESLDGEGLTDTREREMRPSRIAPPSGAHKAAAQDKLKRRPEEPPAPPSRGADVQTLRRGLARSRDNAGVFGRLKALFGGERQIDASLAQEIEEVLLTSDVGTATTQTLLARLRESLDKGELKNADAVWKALRQEAVRMLNVSERVSALGAGGIDIRQIPTVVLFVGVNGAGKTTTIGKLATQLQAAGKKCVLAAGDTFRAAAVQQLVIWGKRVGCEVVHGKDGADPASVLFEAIKKAEEVGADVVLADTAGRLHTKANLMNEMQKIARSAGKALSGAPHEIFLVIDATNGQNALAQAREFKEALNITGIVLTKLDGTAKGGVVLGICDSLRVPVRFVGMGEGPDDLHEFIPQRFVDALLGDEHAA